MFEILDLSLPNTMLLCFISRTPLPPKPKYKTTTHVKMFISVESYADISHAL